MQQSASSNGCRCWVYSSTSCRSRTKRWSCTVIEWCLGSFRPFRRLKESNGLHNCLHLAKDNLRCVQKSVLAELVMKVKDARAIFRAEMLNYPMCLRGSVEETLEIPGKLSE
eukprot:8099248-Pyramimonas_sp.AAC.1